MQPSGTQTKSSNGFQTCACACVGARRASEGEAGGLHRKSLGLNDVTHAGFIHDASLGIRVAETQERDWIMAIVGVRKVARQHAV